MSRSQWPISSLGGTVKFISGGTPKKNESKYWNGNIPWVSSGEMSSSRIYDTQRRVTEDGANNGTKLAPKNTIFVVVRGMSLAKEFRVSLAMREMTFNQDVKAVYPSKSVNPIFLFYYLKSQSNAIRDSASEAAHGTKKLDMPVLEQWPIPIPPIETQIKIAAVLSAYDELIEANNRRIALLEKMAEELYREWFVRLRFPGHQKTKFHKGIPEGWNVKSIGEICSKVTDGSHFSPPQYENGKYMASVKDMTAHGFNRAVMKTISEQDYENLKKSDCKPQENDILIAKDGSYLKHVFVWRDSYDLVLLSSIAILRPNLEEILPLYFSSVLKQDATKAMMSCYVSGSALPRIILKDFKKMGILIPRFEVMAKFEEIADPITAEIKLLERSNEKLAEIRDRLLTRLISGKLSVEALEIEFPPGMEE